jgi:hypothetical protein
MHGLMQDHPLLISSIIRHAAMSRAKVALAEARAGLASPRKIGARHLLIRAAIRSSAP